MKKLTLVITMMVLAVAFLQGEYYIKTKTHTSAMEMMGQKVPEKNSISEQWLGQNKMATVSPEQTTVIDISQSKVFIIYHAQKSYVETSFPLDMSKLLPKEMAGLMGMMKIKIKVTPNGQTKTINGRRCEGYNMEMDMMMGKTKSMIWASTDLPFDWQGYKKMYSSLINTVSPMLDAAAITEIMKINGFQIAQEMSVSVMGKEMKTTMEVVEISEKPAPEGLYSVPAGYKKIDKIISQMGK